jgi:hypothetical protein
LLDEDAAWAATRADAVPSKGAIDFEFLSNITAFQRHEKPLQAAAAGNGEEAALCEGVLTASY